jgi:hypothetical protein
MSAELTTPLKDLAPDLTKTFPRSPRETLAGYVIAARLLDKCRAELVGKQGEYIYNSGLDQKFFDFTGIDAEALKSFVATGADDAAVAEWIQAQSRIKDRLEVIRWNNELRGTLIKDMPLSDQGYIEDYIAQNLPKGRPVYFLFDILDIEEGRL